MKWVFGIIGATSMFAGIYMVAADMIISDIQLILVAVLVLGGLNLMKEQR